MCLCKLQSKIAEHQVLLKCVQLSGSDYSCNFFSKEGFKYPLLTKLLGDGCNASVSRGAISHTCRSIWGCVCVCGGLLGECRSMTWPK